MKLIKPKSLDRCFIMLLSQEIILIKSKASCEVSMSKEGGQGRPEGAKNQKSASPKEQVSPHTESAGGTPLVSFKEKNVLVDRVNHYVNRMLEKGLITEKRASGFKKNFFVPERKEEDAPGPRGAVFDCIDLEPDVPNHSKFTG
jgi:hypothetical protein